MQKRLHLRAIVLPPELEAHDIRQEVSSLCVFQQRWKALSLAMGFLCSLKTEYEEK